MVILKCKMCGGNLESIEGAGFCVCDSCGSKMTLPKSDDERILNLFNRANNYRMMSEFDKALATYENILATDASNAEAYWGCVLSRYGIEYVEDEATHKRVPTCHRVQYTDILLDADYLSALENAGDEYLRTLYAEEAERISEIQKNILNVVREEEPYDVFICYKETDSEGKRTVDSVLAQDIYDRLTVSGYKVFFSRITLEKKLGVEYEPYIFSALNSAKIMLLISTRAEYVNAVWVRNEWMRFLQIVKKSPDKLLIPCYRDMDAYELPEELSLLQSQDMGKIGFMQDLLYGISKVIGSKEKEKENHHSSATPESALLKRAFLLMEESEWLKADDLIESVLNVEPENAKAYVGKLMLEFRITHEEKLREVEADFSISPNYIKAMRFGDDELKATLSTYYESAKSKQLKAEAKRKEDEQKKLERDKRISEELKALKEEYAKIDKEVTQRVQKRLPLFVLGLLLVIAIGSWMMASSARPENTAMVVLPIMMAVAFFIPLLSGVSDGYIRIAQVKAKMLLLEEEAEMCSFDDSQRAVLKVIANTKMVLASFGFTASVIKKVLESSDVPYSKEVAKTVANEIRLYNPNNRKY